MFVRHSLLDIVEELWQRRKQLLGDFVPRTGGKASRAAISTARMSISCDSAIELIVFTCKCISKAKRSHTGQRPCR
jgi:hypothetical protein